MQPLINAKQIYTIEVVINESINNKIKNVVLPSIYVNMSQ